MDVEWRMVSLNVCSSVARFPKVEQRWRFPDEFPIASTSQPLLFFQGFSLRVDCELTDPHFIEESIPAPFLVKYRANAEQLPENARPNSDSSSKSEAAEASIASRRNTS
jgi:hypothetical protein